MPWMQDEQQRAARPPRLVHAHVAGAAVSAVVALAWLARGPVTAAIMRMMVRQSWPGPLGG